MNKLHNCPNCAGYLNDSGRCEFCGSKVYDFVNVDFDNHSKSYLRMRYNGKIINMPVVFHFGSITTDYAMSTAEVEGYSRTVALVNQPIITGSIDYQVVGEIITETNDEN